MISKPKPVEPTSHDDCPSQTRWAKQIEPKTTRHRRATKIDAQALRRDVARNPDAYQYGRAQCFGVSARGMGMPCIG